MFTSISPQKHRAPNQFLQSVNFARLASPASLTTSPVVANIFAMFSIAALLAANLALSAAAKSAAAWRAFDSAILESAICASRARMYLSSSTFSCYNDEGKGAMS